MMPAREAATPVASAGSTSRSQGFRKWIGSGPTRHSVIGILIFLVPILVLEFVQCQSLGCSLFLGWDSSTYAWWATQVQANGAPTMVLRWSYPHFYVLLLSAFGSVLRSVELAEHILPIIVALPLGYASYRLTARLTGSVRLAWAAALFGGLSVSTIAMVADYQRNLLSFGIALLLGESIYTSLFGREQSPKRPWPASLAIWVPFMFVVLGTQIETYVALAVSVLIASVLSRKLIPCLRGVLTVLVPLALAAPIVYGYLMGYQSDTSNLLPFGLADFLWGIWIYLSGFAIPFILIGFVVLVRKGHSGDPTAGFLLSWLASLAVLVPIAGLVNVPAARLVPMVPVPIMMAISLPAIADWLKQTAGRLSRRGTETTTALPGHTLGRPANQPSATLTPKSASMALAVLLAVAPLVATTLLTKDQLLNPYVRQGDVDQLWSAANLLHQLGYSNAVLVLYGADSAYYAPIYRAYFGMRFPENLAYYGKLQFLFSLPDPPTVYLWKYNPPSEGSYAAGYQHEIRSTIGLGGIESLPVVLASASTYAAVPSEIFLNRFRISPGVYVIPPGILTERDMDTWRLFAYGDCYQCLQGTPSATNWSDAPRTLSYADLSGTGLFDATYTLSLRRAWTSAEVSVRFWNWPLAYSVNGTNGTLAPLQIYFDGTLAATHLYGGTGMFNLTIARGMTSAGVHRIELRSGSPGHGVEVEIDDLMFTPLT